MDHPLNSKSQKELRGRVVQFICNALLVQNQSNLVFVCGGNDADCMRRKFFEYFKSNLADHEFFEPEFAMKSYFSSEDIEPFNIAEFEEIVAKLSHCIVIFPEAPGSFAELGYFSTNEIIRRKIILAIDSNRQMMDSFISLGPANLIQRHSKFHSNIQLDYKNPDFDLIKVRLTTRAPLTKNKRSLLLNKFNSLSDYEIYALTKAIVSILTIATLEDIFYIYSSIFKNVYNRSKIKQIISILVGSNHIRTVGDFGHFSVVENSRGLTSVRDGLLNTNSEIRLQLLEVYINSDPEFYKVVQEARNVD